MDIKQDSRKSIYERIGFTGLLGVVWGATPFYKMPISLPYGLSVYYRMLSQCSDTDELCNMHGTKYIRSPWFRSLRPRYRLAKQILKKYGVQ